MKNEQRRILLAENDRNLGLTLARALNIGSEGKFQVDVFETGADAFSAVKENDYDLVITELRMKRLSGLKLLEKILHHHPGIRTMLISDYGTEELRNQVLPRIDGFIKKPFDLLEFIDTVREVAGKAKAESQPARNDEDYGNESILIMEDDPGLGRIYSKALGKTDYKLDLATTVLEAREMIENNKYKLFICDIHMGRERGTDILEEYREHLRKNGTQVIMVSAYGQYRTLTHEMGADFFLEKPISLGTLLTLIDRIMGYENGTGPTSKLTNAAPYIQFQNNTKVAYPIEQSN